MGILEICSGKFLLLSSRKKASDCFSAWQITFLFAFSEIPNGDKTHHLNARQTFSLLGYLCHCFTIYKFLNILWDILELLFFCEACNLLRKPLQKSLCISQKCSQGFRTFESFINLFPLTDFYWVFNLTQTLCWAPDIVHQ